MLMDWLKLKNWEVSLGCDLKHSVSPPAIYVPGGTSNPFIYCSVWWKYTRGRYITPTSKPSSLTSSQLSPLLHFFLIRRRRHCHLIRRTTIKRQNYIWCIIPHVRKNIQTIMGLCSECVDIRMGLVGRMLVRWMCGVSLKDKKCSVDLCGLFGYTVWRMWWGMADHLRFWHFDRRIVQGIGL